MSDNPKGERRRSRFDSPGMRKAKAATEYGMNQLRKLAAEEAKNPNANKRKVKIKVAPGKTGNKIKHKTKTNKSGNKENITG